MSQLEKALEIPLHKKTIRFWYHKARDCYYIQINDDDKNRITEREVDIVIKGLEIIKIKMGSPSTRALFVKPTVPKKKKH